MAAGDKEVREVKLAYREGQVGDFSLYLAPGDYSELEALDHGIKLSEEAARRVMFVLGWYRGDDLIYRP